MLNNYLSIVSAGALHCSPVQCPPGCKEEVGEEGCPSCTCSLHCSPPKCDPGCTIETLPPLGKCPGCVCGDQTRESDSVTSLEMVYKLFF